MLFIIENLFLNPIYRKIMAFNALEARSRLSVRKCMRYQRRNAAAGPAVCRSSGPPHGQE